MKFYRISARNTSESDYPYMVLEAEIFVVAKETPKGYWIKRDSIFQWSKNKWVSKTARKRFAYPTIEEARASFKARKQRHVAILKYQLKMAEAALALV